MLVFHFPDLDDAYSFGEDEIDALKSAKEVLKLSLKSRVADGEPIPTPTKLKDIILDPGQYTSLVEVLVETKVKFDKKTLTIPHDINEAATKAGLNFSKILTGALVEQLEKHSK